MHRCVAGAYAVQLVSVGTGMGPAWVGGDVMLDSTFATGSEHPDDLVRGFVVAQPPVSTFDLGTMSDHIMDTGQILANPDRKPPFTTWRTKLCWAAVPVRPGSPHDWLLTTLLLIIERSRIGALPRGEVARRLTPAVDHLLHLRTPAARINQSRSRSV